MRRAGSDTNQVARSKCGIPLKAANYLPHSVTAARRLVWGHGKTIRQAMTGKKCLRASAKLHMLLTGRCRFGGPFRSLLVSCDDMHGLRGPAGGKRGIRFQSIQPGARRAHRKFCCVAAYHTASLRSGDSVQQTIPSTRFFLPLR